MYHIHIIFACMNRICTDESEGVPELENDFKQKIEYIVSVLHEAGYDPYEQLYAYLHTGNDTYITRKGDTRSLVSELDREQIWAYIAPHIKQKGR